MGNDGMAGLQTGIGMLQVKYFGDCCYSDLLTAVALPGREGA